LEAVVIFRPGCDELTRPGADSFVGQFSWAVVLGQFSWAVYLGSVVGQFTWAV